MGDVIIRDRKPWATGLLLVLVCAPPAFACSSHALRAEIAALKARLQALQARTPHPATPQARPKRQHSEHSAPQSAAPWRERWARLRHHMSERAVRSLLGRPQRIFVVGQGPVWYYHRRGLGSGSVAFGSDRRVLEWQQPSFGSGW